MEQEKETYAYFEAFLKGELKRSELEKLFTSLQYLDDKQLEEVIHSVLDQHTTPMDGDIVQERVDILHQRILDQIDSRRIIKSSRRSDRRFWIAGIAAAIALVFTLGYFLYHDLSEEVAPVVSSAEDIIPGTTKAVISVDGQSYELDGTQSELILSADSLYYTNGKRLPIDHAPQKIQVKTPYGGQYNLLLADGTKVWLNAGSELAYNSSFGIQDRAVKLVGEAYFEVTHNAKLPFTIATTNQQITVLGTSFNVNAYVEEMATKTTLRTGSLKVDAAGEEIVLRPNQQTIFNTGKNTLHRVDVDAESAIAWRDGIMDLHGMSLQECMRMIGRWYDLRIIYASEIPDIQLGGKMSRGVKLSSFLQFLEQNFEVKGEVTSDRKLVIRKIDNH
ncbi:FecR family protein [Sphingobacterium sp. LRF_L2]|uniref:FecR family protein n=1 Tax=Sphingobacterium sp. LRF_L2 TaxID=3369421 RepID=UPI003F5EFA03